MLPGRCREREQSVAVVGGCQSDEFVLPGLPGLDPVLAGKLEGRFDRFGAAGKRVDPLEIAGREGRDLRCQLLYGLMGEGGAVDVGDPAGLIRHSLADLREAVPQGGHERPAGPIEVSFALVVHQPAALPPSD